MVDWQIMAGQENDWRLPVQLCRSVARHLPAHESNDEPVDEQQHTEPEECAPKVQDVSQTVRSLFQSAALHHGQDKRDVQGGL